MTLQRPRVCLLVTCDGSPNAPAFLPNMLHLLSLLAEGGVQSQGKSLYPLGQSESHPLTGEKWSDQAAGIQLRRTFQAKPLVSGTLGLSDKEERVVVAFIEL